MPTKEDLRYYQSLPLDMKVMMTKNRLYEAFDTFGDNGLSLSFSGGKDSTVLADITAQLCQEMGWKLNLLFSDTGLEYAAIRQHAMHDFPEWLRQTYGIEVNADVVKPKMRFSEVISAYGYPIISKEVAECIYYARRIRSRERERENGAAQTSRVALPLKRRKLLGKATTPRTSATAGVVPIGTTGVGGVFSGNEFGDRSLFNKEKWLPAAQSLPFFISQNCCNVMKKSPIRIYQRRMKRVPIIATLAEESRLRKQMWIRHGCNAFDGDKKSSQPMSFWLEQDVLSYIKQNNLPVCSVYGEIVGENDNYALDDTGCRLHCTGCQRTGCVFCMFGAHSRDDRRFLELAEISPQQYDYCMRGGQWVDNPHYDPAAPEYDGDWKNWNPKKIWVPSKNGLGMRFVIDEFNKLYPNNKIKY